MEMEELGTESAFAGNWEGFGGWERERKRAGDMDEMPQTSETISE